MIDDESASRVGEVDGSSAGGSGPAGQRLPAAGRIRNGGEIRNLLGRGKRKRTEHLDVFFAASPAFRCRFGQVVPKHRHDLVERNRLRRRLREIGRRDVIPRLWQAGARVDFLVRAKRQAYDATFDELRGEILTATDEICSGRS
jgi:ribonuclease P protein component